MEFVRLGDFIMLFEPNSYYLGNSIDNLEKLSYDYLYTGIPCYEDLKFFGVTTNEPETYKTKFLDMLIPLLKPSLGTITIAFTGSRRNNGRILPKSFFLQQSMFENGYYLRDLKHAKKGNKFNAYSHQSIEVFTFQKNNTKCIYNLQKNQLYARYGLDFWGPFNKEKLIDGEVVGQPIEFSSYCIENFTDEGHIVMDPFTGLGTTLEAARAANRKYLGFELRENIWMHGLGINPLLNGKRIE